MVTPVAVVAETVNCVAARATLFELAASEMVSGATTTTVVFAVAVAPPLSVAVADAVYVPAAAYTCCVVAVALIAPRSVAAVLSPNVTRTFWMVALLPAAGAAVIVNVVGALLTGF